MHTSDLLRTFVAMKFKDYKLAGALKNTLELVGFVKPTDIQFKAIQAILDGQDVMAVAPTGTGKTAAYAIPIIQKLLEGKQIDAPRALVLAPTRELAFQIAEQFEALGSVVGLSAHCGLRAVIDSPVRQRLAGRDVRLRSRLPRWLRWRG